MLAVLRKPTIIVAVVLAALAGQTAYSVARDWNETTRQRNVLVRDMSRAVAEQVHRTVKGADIALTETAAVLRLKQLYASL